MSPQTQKCAWPISSVIITAVKLTLRNNHYTAIFEALCATEAFPEFFNYYMWGVQEVLYVCVVKDWSSGGHT